VSRCYKLIWKVGIHVNLCITFGVDECVRPWFIRLVRDPPRDRDLCLRDNGVIGGHLSPMSAITE
jgi:hypothetical protein